MMRQTCYISTFLAFFILCTHISSSTKNEKCSEHVVVHNNQIILAKKSEESGAEFLATETSSSVDACLNSCCQRDECTVAVYENKVLVSDQHICYLFNCHQPNVCSFLKHDNYVTLTKLKTISKNITHQTKVNKPVALRGQCESDSVCDDPNAACVKGFCDCRNGFIQKQGKCVKSICSKPDFEFQCDDTSRSPNCIAIYDKCNGIAQCGDGSDEKQCVATLWRNQANRRPQARPRPGARAGAGLPSSRVINLKPGADPSQRQPAPTQRPPIAPKGSVEHHMALANSPRGRQLPVKEKILHRGRADASPPSHARQMQPGRQKSIAESELQNRLLASESGSRPSSSSSSSPSASSSSYDRAAARSRLLSGLEQVKAAEAEHGDGASGRPDSGDHQPLQKLIDQGYKTVHLPADDKSPYRSSNSYWTDAAGDVSSRDDSSARDWSGGGTSDYYYDPYLRGGSNGNRDITDLLGERYSAPDYNQLYQAAEPSYGKAREQPQAQQQPQSPSQQQYLDYWARQRADKLENTERAGRRRNPFSGPEMNKGYMFNTNMDGSAEKPAAGSAGQGPKPGAKRREDRPVVSTKTATTKTTTKHVAVKAGSHATTAARKPAGTTSHHKKKGDVVIFANGTDTSGGAKDQPKGTDSAARSSEYVAVLQQSYQQAKIAVMVLGLTLGVTAFALAFFICRVRRIKNRLRRGKALTSDEADYLINGMYL